MPSTEITGKTESIVGEMVEITGESSDDDDDDDDDDDEEADHPDGAEMEGKDDHHSSVPVAERGKNLSNFIITCWNFFLIQ